MALTIVTDHKPRPIIDGFDLTEKERKEFNYIDWRDVDAGYECPTFVRYKGELYDLGEFERTIESLKPWHGFISDTFYSGILVRYPDPHDYDYVIVGRFYA